jgi:hypothetical protein
MSVDPVHKVIPAFVVGEINQENADRLIAQTQAVNDGSLHVFFSDQRPQYREAILKAFGQWMQPERQGQRGRRPKPRLVPPPDLLYAQVVKHRRKGRVVKVTTEGFCPWYDFKRLDRGQGFVSPLTSTPPLQFPAPKTPSEKRNVPGTSGSVWDVRKRHHHRPGRQPALCGLHGQGRRHRGYGRVRGPTASLPGLPAPGDEEPLRACLKNARSEPRSAAERRKNCS